MKLYRVGSIAALKQKVWNQAAETKIGDMITDAKTNLSSLYSSLAPTWVSYQSVTQDQPTFQITDAPDPLEDEKESQAAKWIATALELGKKSKESGENFIKQVEMMESWTLEEMVSYLKSWSDKARMSNILAFDHLRDGTLVTVQNDGELRALRTRYDLDTRRSVVDRVDLPYFAKEWSVITSGRSYGSEEGGFAANAQDRRPRRGHGGAPYHRGNGRGYKSSGYRRY
jgi:hypothetical protein